MGGAGDAPLQTADRPRGQARRLRQFLLGQVHPGPQLPQQPGEAQPRLGHRPASPHNLSAPAISTGAELNRAPNSTQTQAASAIPRHPGRTLISGLVSGLVTGPVWCAPPAAVNGGKRPPVNWAATQQGQETIVNPARAIHSLVGILAWLASVPVAHVPARPPRSPGGSPRPPGCSWVESRHCGQAGGYPPLSGPRAPPTARSPGRSSSSQPRPRCSPPRWRSPPTGYGPRGGAKPQPPPETCPRRPHPPHAN